MHPKVAVLFSSYRCNAKCAMCSIWEKQGYSPELTPEQIHKIFSDPILSRSIEVINLTGGEPTIRNDIVEIARILLNDCRSLSRIDMPTNGINSELALDVVERILALLLPTNVKLNVTVSVDGVGDIHEEVRGVKGIFPSVEKTIKGLKELARLYPFLSVALNTTISRINISGIEQMRKFAKAYGLGINFTLSSISEIGVESRKVKNRFELLNEENAFLVSFFKDLLVKKEISDEYGNFVLNWLFTGRRLVACNFRKQAAILIEPNGDAFFCGNFREFRIGSLVNGTYTALAKGFKAPQSKYRDRCKACNSNCYMDVN